MAIDNLWEQVVCVREEEKIIGKKNCLTTAVPVDSPRSEERTRSFVRRD